MSIRMQTGIGVVAVEVACLLPPTNCSIGKASRQSRRSGVDRIVQMVGVAKASLYNLFGNKNQLVEAYLDARTDATRSALSHRNRMIQAGICAADAGADQVPRTN